MSFISDGVKRPSYNPGWFLADDENCTRLTMTISAEDASAVTADDGSVYVPTGAPIVDGDSNLLGFLYEPVDVSEGDAPGSVVTAGTIYDDVLPEGSDPDELPAAFVFVARPTVTRGEDEGE